MKSLLKSGLALVIWLSFWYLSCSKSPEIRLFNNGASTYTIVLAESASPSEEYAAEELQQVIKTMSGATLPILPASSAPSAHRIFVGKNVLTDSLLPDIAAFVFGDEEFLIHTTGNDLYILGGRKRGTMYGVFSFLEEFLNCRWYTREVSKIPQRSTLSLPGINSRQKPAFEYRMPFYTEACSRSWASHNKINGYGADLPDQVGGRMRYAKGKLGHTFYSLVPPEKYFDEHPDYYSMVKGERVRDRGQLCLTNPQVLNVAIAEIERWLAEDPGADIVSITQNDWEDWCECPDCRALDTVEGSHSATVINFVNAIADSLGEKYPGMYFDTFAYTYTQKPPRTLAVRNNVLIRICHMQPSCDAHPLTSCELNAEYIRNLREWRKKGGKLYAWHYVTDFSHYLMPFPNFNAIRKDILSYYREGVAGIFCQGDSQQGGGGEWAELRSYLLAKLLWNPTIDVDRVIDDFMRGVYGAAAGPIRQYFDMMHAAVTAPDQHFNLFSNPDEVAYLTAERIQNAHYLFDKAEMAVAGEPEILARVQKARLPVYYIDLWFQGQRQIEQDISVDKMMLKKFMELISKNGIIYQSERSNLDAFFQTLSAEFRFVRNFKIIGPFEGPKARLLETVQPPEFEIDFNRTYKGVAGKDILWQNWREGDGSYVDFTKILKPDSVGIAYALCYINAPRDLNTQLGIGSNDGVRVFVNDRLMHHHAVLRKASPNSDLIDIGLTEGWNKILVKIDQIGGGWGMYLSVKDTEKILSFSDAGPVN